MNFIEKVASYLETYAVSENKESLLKTAGEEGVCADDLVAFHNLTKGNVFTGENLIQTDTAPEESESKLIQLGLTIDKVASENGDMDEVIKKAEILGLDTEDVAFVYASLQKQAEEAGIIPTEPKNDENVEKGVQILKEAGLNPVAAVEIALNVDEEGNPTDEKVASMIQELTTEEIDKIAEAMELIGEITPEKAQQIITLSE